MSKEVINNKEMAQKLRKIAADIATLKEQRKVETREKCAAAIVAQVGLNILNKKLNSGRR